MTTWVGTKPDVVVEEQPTLDHANVPVLAKFPNAVSLQPAGSASFTPPPIPRTTGRFGRYALRSLILMSLYQALVQPLTGGDRKDKFWVQLDGEICM